ncbi:unnamed protein product [Moneuplotes crassus]|uniref:Uncharacterized protein n=1 Tax=Euplotes crassus TaxID=5936 RepID=A0AAD1XMS4_EUPCR|nr:unnamed protein product [Moneuplotes crassus]
MAFDPFSFKTGYTKNWGWLYALIVLVPFLMVLAITFYVLSLLITDEDLYYKKKSYNNEYVYSTRSYEFSNLEMVAEVLPHSFLADENDRYLPFRFVNNTYFKDVTFDDGEQSKRARFEELSYQTTDDKSNLPHLIFKNEYVPFGDSRFLCLNLKYRSKDEPVAPYDKFNEVQNLPQCHGMKQEIWGEKDPTKGVNLLAWKEFGNQKLSNCKNGIIRDKICYEYAVMESICVIVEPTNDDPSQGWEFVTGCEEGGSTIKYKKASPGQEYTFDNIPIEVRAYREPFYEFETSSTNFGADLSYFGWLSRMCWALCLIAFICLLIFGCYRLNLPSHKDD